jgi:phage I-like protein
VSEKRTPKQLQLGTIAALTGHAAFGFPGVEEGKPRVPPTEFRVFPAGKFTTTKGDYFFTPRSAEAVMALYTSRGNPLKGDYEHQTDAVAMGFPPIEAPASIISMVPEVRMDAAGAPELWVTDVKWTDRARGMLESGEYAMFSPVFPYDKETREVLGLLRIALTNDPAMNFLEPLVAATAGTTTEENPMEGQVTCPKCTAIDAHLATLQSASAKLTADHEKLIADHNTLLGAHQMLTTQLKSFDDWAAEEAAEHEDGDETLTATLTASAGGKKPETKVILAALSARSKELRALRTEVVTLTGGKDKATAVGTLTAWKAQSSELATTKAAVEKERAERQTSEFKGKLVALCTGSAPRISPAQRKAIEASLTTEGLKFATAMLSVLAPGETGAAIVTTEAVSQPGNADVISPEAVAHCKRSGITVEAFLKSQSYLNGPEYKDALERVGK